MVTARKSAINNQEYSEKVDAMAKVYVEYADKLDQIHADFLKKLAEIRKRDDKDRVAALLSLKKEEKSNGSGN